MHHDKKTALVHQDILIRRGFNIPAVDVTEEQLATEDKGKGTEAKNQGTRKGKNRNRKS